MAKTYSAKLTDVKRAWHVVDASSAPLGRLATEVATLLIGKHKPMYTPHIDCGDYVIVVNAAKLQVTGKKHEQKIYYRHSGYPGGIKQATLREKLDKDAADVIVRAVRGMIPSNKLRAGRLARLKVYNGNKHEHEAQKPKQHDLKETK